MACNFNSEIDRDMEQSLEEDKLSIQEITCDAAPHFAGRYSNFQASVKEPPTPRPENVENIVNQLESDYRSNDFYQCADQESGTDSAEEENSPYGSPEKDKYEQLVPSGGQLSSSAKSARRLNEVITDAHISSSVQRASAGPEFFQCSSNWGDNGSESDSGKEEETICTDLNENLAVSGKRYTIKTARIALPPAIATPINTKQYPSTGIQPTKSTLADHESMNEKIRSEKRKLLDTFMKFGWPHKSPSAVVMVEAGFKYLGSCEVREPDGSTRCVDDLVECCFCRKTMHSFEKDDDPKKEHLRLHGKCP